MAWVLVDEHPDSINDDLLYVEPGQTPDNALWVDWPACYHDGACGFSFADGHSEIHKWQDSRTITPVQYVGKNITRVPGSVDYTWVSLRTPP